MISSILDNKDMIIERIVKEKGIPREQIEEMIKKRIDEYGGLLTEAGAAFSIARELGVKLELPEIGEEWIDIGKLSEEMGFANIAGVVKAISPVREWEKEGRSGKLARILLADSTGEIWVILWNQDAELVENRKINLGDIIGIKNGNIRRALNGDLEISLGLRGRVIINPNVDKEFPEIQGSRKIGELKDGMDSVSVFGKVLQVFPVKEFTDGERKGKVASLIISDGDEIRVVLWGDNADLVSKINVGDIVKVENAYTKTNNDRLELHVGWKSRVLVNPEDSPDLSNINAKTETIKRKTINNLKSGELVEIRGTVVQVYPPTIITVCPECGEIVDEICPEHGQSRKTLILNLEIDDGTGVLRGVMFRKTAEDFLGVSEVSRESIDEKINDVLGEEMVFRGVVKENQIFDRLELHIREFEALDLTQEIEMIMGRGD